MCGYHDVSVEFLLSYVLENLLNEVICVLRPSIQFNASPSFKRISIFFLVSLQQKLLREIIFPQIFKVH